MTFIALRLFLIFLVIPVVAHSEVSVFACKNEISSEKRIFKLEKRSGDTVVYTLYKENFYPLCDNSVELPDKEGIICLYGKGSDRQNYVATFFTEDSKKIIDFLIDKNDMVSEFTKWKQKTVSYCSGITTLNF